MNRTEHEALLRYSYEHWLGEALFPPGQDLFEAPFVVVSHGPGDDPVFNYGNRKALDLFELDWDAFTALPSRYSAEASERADRQRLLDEVHRQGYSKSYSGIRISSTGRRFRIDQATVWNLVDEDGNPRGQAATFSEWTEV